MINPTTPAENAQGQRDAAILRELEPCPRTGDGVHHWLFCAALSLHKLGLSVEDITRLLTAATASCGRSVPPSEIADAVSNSSPDQLSAGGGHFQTWPSPNEEKRAEIIKGGAKLADLEVLSPVRFEEKSRHAEDIINWLFPGDPLLCVAVAKKLWDTRPKSTWHGIWDQQQFVVPSTMSALWGRTKSGKDSTRTLENTGPRKYLVIEFDQGTFDEHAALLLHLAKFAPLTMIVHSGNRSLHGWFACGKQEETCLRKFMELAVSLRADRATWTKCQLVRLPDGTRENGARQKVLFFNPSTLEAR